MKNIIRNDRFIFAFMSFVLAATLLLEAGVLAGVSVKGVSPECLLLYFSCGVIILRSLILNKRDFLKIEPKSLLAAASMAASFFFRYVIEGYALSEVPGRIVEAVIVFAAFYCLFRALSLWDSSVWLSPDREGRHLKPCHIAVLAVLFLTILLLQYKGYFPYGQSPDAINQWEQIHGNVPYNTIHAIGHTILLKMLLGIWDNYAFVVLLQLVSVAMLYLCFAEYFYSKGLSLFLISFVLAMGLLWTRAATDAYFYPWKDNPSAICLAIVTLFIAKYTESGKMSIKGAVLLGLGLSGCIIFRLNGIIALIVCGGFFSISFIKRRFYKQLASMLAAVVIPIMAVNIYSDAVLKPIEPDNGFALQVFGSGIAAVVNYDELTEEELAEIDKVLPVEWMQDTYISFAFKRHLLWNEDSSAKIAADPNLSIMNNDFILRMGENKKEVILLYLSLIPGHFPTLIKDILGSTAIIWTQDGLFFVASHAFWAIVIAFLDAKYRQKNRRWLVFLPCLCNTVSIMISTVTNETRYILPSFMLLPFFILYTLLRAESAEETEGSFTPAAYPRPGAVNL